MQKDKDRYGRIVAIVRVVFTNGTSSSVNFWMVRNGWAVAYRQVQSTHAGMGWVSPFPCLSAPQIPQPTFGAATLQAGLQACS